MQCVKRDSRLDNVKWILTILIVLYHIQPVARSGGIDEKIFLYIKNFGDCVVPAFALISGFLFWKNVNSFEVVRKKIVKRVYMLLLPYLLWNFINTILVNILHSGLRNINRNILTINVIDNLIKWDSSPHFWYIFMLMFWTVLAPVLYLAYKHKLGLLLLFISQLFYLLYKGEGILHSRFIYILYTWGGVIGFYKPSLIDNIENWTIKKKKSITIISLGLYLLIGIFTTFFSIKMNVKVWLYAIRAVMLFLGCINLPLLFIGNKTGYKYSFWLFIVHYWLDYCVGILFVSKIANGVIYQFITWGMVTSFGIFSGIAVNSVSKRCFKLLTGNR